MTEKTLPPLTESLLENLRSQDAPSTVLCAAEGADLMRDILTEGTAEAKKLVQATATLIASDPKMAALTIGVLLAVAVKADSLLADGIANFNALPDDVKEQARATVSGE